MRLLASRPRSLEEMTEELDIEDGSRKAFAAFVEIGISLGEIGRRSERYQLRGQLAKALARSELDPFCALAEEITGLHVPYILGAPGERGARRPFTALTEEFAMVVARSSRVLEPILNKVQDHCHTLADSAHSSERPASQTYVAVNLFLSIRISSLSPRGYREAVTYFLGGANRYSTLSIEANKER